MSPASTASENFCNKNNLVNDGACLSSGQQQTQQQQHEHEQSQQQAAQESHQLNIPASAAATAVIALPSFVKKSDSVYDRKFTAEEKKRITQHFARATASAGLPPNWFRDPEVIELFSCFRSHAPDIIPTELPSYGDLYSSSSKRYHPAHSQFYQSSNNMVSL